MFLESGQVGVFESVYGRREAGDGRLERFELGLDRAHLADIGRDPGQVFTGKPTLLGHLALVVLAAISATRQRQAHDCPEEYFQNSHPPHRFTISEKTSTTGVRVG